MPRGAAPATPAAAARLSSRARIAAFAKLQAPPLLSFPFAGAGGKPTGAASGAGAIGGGGAESNESGAPPRKSGRGRGVEAVFPAFPPLLCRRFRARRPLLTFLISFFCGLAPMVVAIVRGAHARARLRLASPRTCKQASPLLDRARHEADSDAKVGKAASCPRAVHKGDSLGKLKFAGGAALVHSARTRGGLLVHVGRPPGRHLKDHKSLRDDFGRKSFLRSLFFFARARPLLTFFSCWCGLAAMMAAIASGARAPRASD